MLRLNTQFSDNTDNPNKEDIVPLVGNSVGTLTDELLWDRVKMGEDEALAEIYTRYADKLFNYGTQITNDRDLAYDIVQDVFLYMVSKKHQLGEIKSVKNYLYSSYRRKLLRVLKRNRKIKLNEDYERLDGFKMEVEADFYALTTPFTLDIKKLLHKISNDLPVRQREIISLYFFEQLSYKEIAGIMDFSNLRSARNLLYKALNNMSEVLKKHEDVLFLLVLLFNIL
ncbi:sigma-70 family RNA polymerase sigma factor [Echinicola marina]|uniref:RNA polymerase sigma factor n=1 Tax=Echinicola marina TaxID=2859768 RepID=UPI001CF6493D|nr:sigma-70 family RNA polymerase sigma factor [Echinicola marina]UCS92010.1 sigma-70 family RNA polymerase sigma factor [Echinicola marina]